MPQLTTESKFAYEPTPAAWLIGDLERGGAITSQQARLLMEGWHELEDEWWSSPYLRTVREHSRAYVDRLRNQSTSNKATS
jgi:hypothetical protein